jgi:hypothetical protein
MKLQMSCYITCLFCIFAGCSSQEVDFKDAEVALQRIIEKQDSLSDWQILAKQIKNSDAGYSIQIKRKCYEAFRDSDPRDQINFRKLSIEDQNLILKGIHYGGPEFLPKTQR